MEKRIKVRKLHESESEADDEYIGNPEECLDIVENLRQEAKNFLYEDGDTFRRIVTVVRRKQG